MSGYFKQLSLLSPLEKGQENDWKDSKGAWLRGQLLQQIVEIKESMYEVRFPENAKNLGFKFNKQKIIQVDSRSLAEKCGVKSGQFIAKIQGNRSPTSTGAITTMIRIACDRGALILTLRPLTKREIKLEKSNGGFRSSSSSRSPSATNASTFKLTEENRVLKRQLLAERKLRENEKQQGKIWKSLMESQLKELENLKDKHLAQLQIANKNLSDAESKVKESKAESAQLRQKFNVAKARELDLAVDLEETKQTLENLKNEHLETENEKKMLEATVKEQKEKIDEVTQLFESGRSLLMTAHGKIGRLEEKLKKVEESELKDTLKQKDEEIESLRKQIKTLSSFSLISNGNVKKEYKKQKKNSLDFKELYEDTDISEGVHGIVVLLVSYCAGVREKSRQERLRHLFAALGYKYEEVDGGLDQSLRKTLVEKSGLSTYPQVFLRSGTGEFTGYVFIGDFNVVFEMNEVGAIHKVFRGCERTERLSPKKSRGSEI